VDGGSDSTNIFNIDQLSTMRLAQEAWRSMKQTTIANCWKHTKILPETEVNSSIGLEAETNNDMTSLQSALNTLQQQLVHLQRPLANLATAEQFVGVEDDCNLHLAYVEIDEILQEPFHFGGENHRNGNDGENGTRGDSGGVDVHLLLQSNRRQSCITDFFRARA
jgi:hypothetical protein